MRKYKKSVPELIAYRNELEKKLNVLDDQDYLLANLEKECKELFDKTKEIAQELTLKRKCSKINWEYQRIFERFNAR